MTDDAHFSPEHKSLEVRRASCLEVVDGYIIQTTTTVTPSHDVAEWRRKAESLDLMVDMTAGYARLLSQLAKVVYTAAERGAVAAVEEVADFLSGVDAVTDEDIAAYELWKRSL